MHTSSSPYPTLVRAVFLTTAVLLLTLSPSRVSAAPAGNDGVPVSPAPEEAANGKPVAETSPVPAAPDREAAPADVDGQAPKLDFEFFDQPSNGATLPSSSQSEREDKVAELVLSRRHRLTVHQTLGLVTWGLMLAASVVGQLNYHDLYGGGSGRGTWLIPHKVLAYASAAMFGTTAGYALLAPTPYPKPLKLDTGLLHRLAAIGASAGMLTQVVLGFITARTADAGNPDGLKRNAQIHQVVGWSTFGLMTVAGAAWVF